MPYLTKCSVDAAAKLVRTRVIGSRARAHVIRSLVLASGGSLVAKVAQRTDRGSQQHVVRLAVTQSLDTHTHTDTSASVAHARTYAHIRTRTRRAVTRCARGPANWLKCTFTLHPRRLHNEARWRRSRPVFLPLRRWCLAVFFFYPHT